MKNAAKMRPARTLNPRRRQQEYESKFDLAALFEFSKNINTTLELNVILSRFLLTIMGKLLSPRSVVLLKISKDLFQIKEIKGLPSAAIDQTITIRKPPRRLVYARREDARKSPYISHFRSQGIDILVPLIAGEEILGIAGFGSRILKKKLTQKEETYVKSLANIAAAAIENSVAVQELRQVNRRLDGKVQELNTLFELSKEFNAVLDTDRLVKLLTFSVLGHVGVNRYFVCLNRYGTMQLVQSRLDREFDPALFRYVCTITAPTKVESLKRAYQSALQEIGIRLLIPLRIGNETKGIVGVGDKIRGGEYSQTDTEFLSSLGNLAIVSLENARLFRDAIEKQKMEDELLIAREIQRGLLPSTLPSIPHFDIAAKTISSRQVGGDYYDIIKLDENRFIIAIGDVSGKGTPASLLMANLQATIRALVPFGYPLTELTKRVNDLMCDNTSSGRFVTFFWGLLDAKVRTLRYVNAGHNPPFVFRTDGTVERLDRGGIILGVIRTIAPYQDGEVAFNPGDVLVLFTDGVSEAMNDQSEEFGEPRLEQLAKENLGESPQTVLSRIVEAVQGHSRNLPQSDDITLLLLKATG